MTRDREREREIDSRLADWVDGTLGGRERERFTAELRVNAQLRRDLADYEKTVATVRAALQAPTVKTDLADRVLAAIAEQRSGAARRAGVRLGPLQLPPFTKQTLRSKPVVWSLASAAALLAIALVLDAWPSGAKTELVATNAIAPPSESLDELLADREDDAPPPAARPRDKVDDAAARTLVPDAEAKVGRVAAEPPPLDTGPEVETVAPDAPAAPAPSAPAPGAPAVPDPKPGTAPSFDFAKQREAELRDEVRADATGEAHDDPAKTRKAPDREMRYGQGMRAGGKQVVRGGEASRAAKVGDGAAAAAPAGERLPLLLLQGDATDSTEKMERGASGPTTDARRSRDLTTESVSRTREQAIDLFFTDQMRIAPATSVASMALAPTTLRVRAIETPKEPTRDTDPAGTSTGLSAVERTWLVEGSKEEVATLLQRLGAFAKARNLDLRSGEHVLVPPPPPEGTTTTGGPDAASGEERLGAKKEDERGAAKSAAAAPTTRVLLRFRLLRR